MPPTLTTRMQRLASGSAAGCSGRQHSTPVGCKPTRLHSRRQPAPTVGPTRLSALQRPANAALMGSLAAAMVLSSCNSAQAATQLPPMLHIRTETLLKQQMATDNTTSGGDTGFRPGPITRAPPFSAGKLGATSTASVAAQAADALQRLETARADIDAGRHQEALVGFSEIVNRYGDLALSEYARLGRALELYEVGQPSQALLELEDEEVSMKGQAEVHAALAAVLYAERPAQRLRAEQQWDAAQAFDTRYSDTDWVRQAKHWPPRMVQALDSFLKLQ